MTLTNTQHKRVLSIVFNMRGFGFAVLDGEALIDWGIKKVAAGESSVALDKVKGLISVYTPDAIVFEDLALSPFRHSSRIQDLTDSLPELAQASGIVAVRLGLSEVKRVFFGDGEGTKHEIATELVRRFPEELGHLLPRKRLAWTTEHYRMGIFDAVALVATLRRTT